MIMQNELSVALLVAGIMSVWFKSAVYWKLLLIVFLAHAFYRADIEPVAFVAIGLLSILVYLSCTVDPMTKRHHLWNLLLILLAFFLGLHLVPGFNNWPYVENHALGENLAEFSIWFNYDKALFGLIVLGGIFQPYLIRSRQEWLDFTVQACRPIVLGVVLVYLLALAMAYVRIDLSLDVVFFAWAVKNLFFTVIAEEIVFRGILQRQLSKLLSGFARADGYAIAAGAVLFGLAHFSGGWKYVVLSTAAGMVYGYTYAVTKRIEGPIIAHFLLNVGHFLFFSYPYSTV